MQYAKVPIEGAITFHEVERIELEGLYEATGADTVEAVTLTREGQDAVLWLDEEGKLDGRKANRRADYLAHMFSGVMPHDIIVGDCAITGPADDRDGETTSLSEEWRQFLADLPADIEQPA